MFKLNDYPHPSWLYSSTSGRPPYKWEEKDDKIITTIDLPGMGQEQITVLYQSENRCINVEVEGAQGYNIYLSREIDPDKITARLELGVLTIEAPIKNTDKRIEIK